MHEFQLRAVSFYQTEQFYRTPDLHLAAADDPTPFRKVPIPDDTSLGTFGGEATLLLRSAWAPPKAPGGREYAAGTLLAAPLEHVMQGDWSAATVLFEPHADGSTSLQAHTYSYCGRTCYSDTAYSLWLYLRCCRATRPRPTTWYLRRVATYVPSSAFGGTGPQAGAMRLAAAAAAAAAEAAAVEAAEEGGQVRSGARCWCRTFTRPRSPSCRPCRSASQRAVKRILLLPSGCYCSFTFLLLLTVQAQVREALRRHRKVVFFAHHQARTLQPYFTLWRASILCM